MMIQFSALSGKTGFSRILLIDDQLSFRALDRSNVWENLVSSPRNPVNKEVEMTYLKQRSATLAKLGFVK